MVDLCGGLRVLELGSSSAAASITGMVLADAGARVLKIEPPEGDRLRSVNPNGFRVWNRGKESVLADLRTESGREALLSFVADADILIEAFRPGVMTAWDLDPHTLRSRNDRLIHCHITAFGRTGPLSRIPGYDSLVAARVGLCSRGDFGYRSGGFLYDVPWGSFGAAMQSVAGIAGALLVRDRTGRGQELDTTLCGGIDPLDYYFSTVAQVMGKKARLAVARGEEGAAVAPRPATRFGGLYATRDSRFLQTATILPHQGRALNEAAGLGHLLDEERFANLPTFANAYDARDWEDMLLEAFRERNLAEWVPKLMASPDIAFEVAITSEEGTHHPQIVHNGDVVTIGDPDVGDMVQVGPLGHFSSTPMTPRSPAPAIGANHGPFASDDAPASSTAGADAGPCPFSGITIVEFGYFYAMPYGITMLASLGARVIKIEDGSGDPHRISFGEELASSKTTAAKESISIDLRTPDGRRIAQQIVSGANVFVNGFRTGVAEKLGLGEAELRTLNPGLLYVHAAGYGSDGPYANRALYAQAAQAVGGSFGRQVGYWCDPDFSRDMTTIELAAVVLPRLAQVVDGDSNAALAVLAAVALGAWHQNRTGEGQLLRTSMIASNAWAYSDDFCRFEGKVAATGTGEDFVGVRALDHLYPCADRTEVCLHVETDREFAALAGQLSGALLDDRFATGAGRARHDEELTAVLTAAFAARPAAEWETMLLAVGVGCVEVNMTGIANVMGFDPALREADLTLAFEHPIFGELVRSAPPVSYSESRCRIGLPCQRGEHNRAILTELGYDEATIEDLEAKGAVRPPTFVEPLPVTM